MKNFKSYYTTAKKIFYYYKDEKKKYILGIILGVFEYALLFATPYMSELLVDIATGEQSGNVVLMAFYLLILYLILVPLVVYGTYLKNCSSAKATVNIRTDLFKHICSIKHSKSAQYKTGDYIIRMTNDAQNAVGFFTSFGMTCLFRFLAVTPVALVLLFMSDFRIAIIAIIYCSFSLIFSVKLNPYVKKLENEAKIEIGNSASFLIEVMRGIPIVKVFTLKAVLEEKYSNVCKIIKCKRIKFRAMNGISYGVVDFFTYSAGAVGFIIAIFFSLKSGSSLGGAVYNASIVSILGDCMLRLSTFLLLIQPKLVAAERVFEILDIETEEQSKSQVNIKENSDIAVEFKNVDFAYTSGKNVLSDINLQIKKGESLAIVGGSGGGKSTLIKLIESFYEPTSGSVSYFGNSNLNCMDIRNLCSYIPQECSLFEGSIAENIGYGKKNSSLDEIKEAAKTAELSDFIESLENKYESQIGERGTKLSGGQKQRIAIARAVIRNCPILLLDEATAALDSKTEKEIQVALEKIAKTKTTVTVAHRLSTVKNCDRIIVMEQGKIVEEGNFDSLLALNGRFTELYNKQFKEE